MARLFCLVCLCVLVFTAWLASAPVAGQKALKVTLKTAIKQDGKVIPTQYETQEKFQGGRRACVIIEGDHDPVVPLSLHIYDLKEQLIAQDEGDDFAAAIWYPARDATYKIVVKNYGTEYKKGLEYTDVRIVLK